MFFAGGDNHPSTEQVQCCLSLVTTENMSHTALRRRAATVVARHMSYTQETNVFFPAPNIWKAEVYVRLFLPIKRGRGGGGGGVRLPRIEEGQCRESGPSDPLMISPSP